ncbi:MAG: 2-dehydro-3-deoxy-6-phosphogalactonate aldolase [Lentisphaeria bacterium]|nr:2-dehydro-3-deoxy-6-phosphogalactonate aldolase [Lentisphaeria bacterium]
MRSYEEFAAECPLVAILRGIRTGEVEKVCDALYDGGIRLLEITLNTSGALESISRAVRYVGDRQLVGAGTVLTPDEVDAVAQHGGKFIISPNTDPAVIRRTKELGLISIPGFFTPTEAFTAIAAGADYLKCFPAGRFGAGYVKDLKAVVPKPIYAVGAVGRDNLASFFPICAGAGIGSAIFKPGKTPDQIRADAAAMVEIWRSTAAK